MNLPLKLQVLAYLILIFAGTSSIYSIRISKGVIDMIREHDAVDTPRSKHNSKGERFAPRRSHGKIDKDRRSLRSKDYDRIDRLRDLIKSKLAWKNCSADISAGACKQVQPDLAQEKNNTKDRGFASFSSLGIHAEVVKGLYLAGYKFPTVVQRQVVPPMLEGRDVVVMARTGSGKTAAFLVPAICRLIELTAPGKLAGLVQGVQCLVLEPTRELAIQTFLFCKKYSKFTSLNSIVITGGESIEAQFAALATNPDILVATPGRLMQLVHEIKPFSLRSVRICILDEADRLFESSHVAVVKQLLEAMRRDTLRLEDRPPSSPEEAQRSDPSHMQVALVSATLPRELAEFAQTGLRGDRVVVRLDVERMLSEKLRVAFLQVLNSERMPTLLFLLRDILLRREDEPLDDPNRLFDDRGLLSGRAPDAEEDGPDARYRNKQMKRTRCLVFCATRHTVEALISVLAQAGVRAEGAHGGMDQEQRNLALERFKTREVQVLLVTDVAARGLDVPLLDDVVHYDFPPTPKLFVHRCGRVGRAGASGRVHALVSPRELPHLIDVCSFLCRPLREVPTANTSDHASADAPDNFLLGRPPCLRIGHWKDVISHAVGTDGGLSGQLATAQRGYDLYWRTRPPASEDAEKAANELLEGKTIGTRVHVWYKFLAAETGDDLLSSDDLEAMQERFREVADWEPRTAEQIGSAWQHELYEAAKPLRARLERDRANAAIAASEATADQMLANFAKMNSSQTQVAPAQIQVLQQRKPSLRTLQRRSQKDLTAVSDPDDEDEQWRELGLRAGTGGAMGTKTENPFELDRQLREAAVELGGGDEGAQARKKRRVWDGSKMKFVNEDQLAGPQAKVLRVLRNEAGVKVPAVPTDGRLYARWASVNKIRIQEIGERVSEKIVARAAARAMVNLRRSAVAAPANAPPLAGGKGDSKGRGVPQPAPLEGEESAPMVRAKASLVAGPNRPPREVLHVPSLKLTPPTARPAIPAGLSQQEAKRLRIRRERAEKHRKHLEMKRRGEDRPMPPKLLAAMEARAESLRKKCKGLRVGKQVTARAALQMHKRGMKDSMRNLKKGGMKKSSGPAKSKGPSHSKKHHTAGKKRG